MYCVKYDFQHTMCTTRNINTILDSGPAWSPYTLYMLYSLYRIGSQLTESDRTAAAVPLSCMPLPLPPPATTGGHEDDGTEDPETAMTSSSPRVAAAAAAAGESRSTTSIMSTDDGPEGAAE